MNRIRRKKNLTAYAEPAVSRAVSSEEIATIDASPDMLALGMTLPNPDQVLRKLGISIKTYRELAEETRVGSYMETRRSGAVGGEWELLPKKADKKVIDEVQTVLDSINLTKLMEQIHNAVGFGYQPLEIVWKYVDGKIRPDRIIAKPQEWFLWDQEGHLRFLTKENPIDGIDLTDPEYTRKFLVAQVGDSYTNPYGTPLYSRVYWYVAFKKGGFKFWTKFIEKFGTPWLFARYRSGAGEAERDTLMDALEQMVQDALAVIPEGNTVEAVKDIDRTGAVDAYLKYLEFCNKEITIAILGHTGGGESTPGKLGSENGALEVKADRVESDQNLIASVMNKLIRWIVDLNFGENAEAPLFAFEEEEADQKTIAERDKVLFDMGMTPTETYFTERWGMKKEWFTVKSPDTAAPNPVPAIAPAQFSESVSFGAISQGYLTKRSLDYINHNDTINTIKVMASKAESLEELLTMLESVVSSADPVESSAAEETLTAAELLGRYDVLAELGKIK